MRKVLLLLFLPLAVFGLSAYGARNPVLPTERIEVDSARTGPHPFIVEIAADDASRENGLMFRTRMAPDAGMLFDFHDPQQVAFWMENTMLPLDMLFVRADGTIANIRADAVPYSREAIPSAGPVRLVIELNGGVAAKLGLKAGDRIKAPDLERR